MGESWVNVEVGQVLAETNQGHGDCLFVAISQQLEGQLTPPQLRAMAVDYLENHREEMHEELLSLGWDMTEFGEIPIPLEGDILIDAVLQTLRSPHTWAGAECLEALSLCLNRGIRVYQEGGPTIVFPEEDNPGLRILLRYPLGNCNRRTHYESVLNWRLGPVNQPSTSTADAECQTDNHSSPVPVSSVSTFQSNSGSTTAVENTCNSPPSQQAARSNSLMVLRSRRADQQTGNLFRDGNFSAGLPD